MRTGNLGLALATVGLLLTAAHSSAQQVTVGTPFHQLNDGFYENMGTSWSLNGKGWNFRYGSPNNASPQFGGFQPGAGLNFGFGRMVGGVSGQFNANFSQGYRQSLVSQTPMLTLQNGATGYVADRSLSPFVIGYIPVLGGYPMFTGYPLIGSVGPAPLSVYHNAVPEGAAIPGGNAAVQEALRRAKSGSAGNAQRQLAGLPAEDGGVPPPPRPMAQAREKEDDSVLNAAAAGDSLNRPADPVGQLQASSAGRAVPSVAEAQRLRAAEKASQNNDAMRYVELARGAEESDKPSVARLYYQMAARRASGELKSQILVRLDELKGQSKGGK